MVIISWSAFVAGVAGVFSKNRICQRNWRNGRNSGRCGVRKRSRIRGNRQKFPGCVSRRVSGPMGHTVFVDYPPKNLRTISGTSIQTISANSRSSSVLLTNTESKNYIRCTLTKRQNTSQSILERLVIKYFSKTRKLSANIHSSSVLLTKANIVASNNQC
jgi:hypothetical protein